MTKKLGGEKRTSEQDFLNTVAAAKKDAVRSKFVLSYRWLDLAPNAPVNEEAYDTLQEAEEARDKMMKEEVLRRDAFDHTAVLEVKIDQYDYVQTLSTVTTKETLQDEQKS